MNTRCPVLDPSLQPRGDWMQTWTGRRFFPGDPRPDAVCIEDIAHALARLCRFGGHVNVTHYSVAQHSVLCSRIVRPELALRALLHDASEAYVVDVPRALKRLLPEYKRIEERVQRAIGLALGVERLEEEPLDVQRADEIALATERRDIMAQGPFWNQLTEKPLRKRIEPWSAEVAEVEFLDRYAELTGANVPATAPGAAQ